MIKSDLRAIWDSVENIMARADDIQAARLSVYYFGQVIQLSAIKQRDGLQTQADTENRFGLTIFPEDIEHCGLLPWQAGAWRKNDLVVRGSC